MCCFSACGLGEGDTFATLELRLSALRALDGFAAVAEAAAGFLTAYTDGLSALALGELPDAWNAIVLRSVSKERLSARPPARTRCSASRGDDGCVDWRGDGGAR